MAGSYKQRPANGGVVTGVVEEVHLSQEKRGCIQLQEKRSCCASVPGILLRC